MSGPTFLEIRTRIVEKFPQLSPQLRLICEFALANPDIMAVEPIARISGRLAVQPSSLVRFAKALGYASFSELKRGFKSNLIFRNAASSLVSLQCEIAAAGAAGLVSAAIQSAHRQLDRVAETIEPGVLEDAAKAVRAAEEVYVFAQHLSYSCASLFTWDMIQRGRRCHLLDNVGGFALRHSELATSRDALIAVSLAPYQPSVVAAAKTHAAIGGVVVAITDSQLSPLATHATFLLELPPLAKDGVQSLSGLSVLLGVLAVLVTRN